MAKTKEITRNEIINSIAKAYPELNIKDILRIMRKDFIEFEYSSKTIYVHRYKNTEEQKEFALNLFCSIYQNTSFLKCDIDGLFGIFRLSLMNAIKNEEKLQQTLSEHHYLEFLQYCEIPDL